MTCLGSGLLKAADAFHYHSDPLYSCVFLLSTHYGHHKIIHVGAMFPSRSSVTHRHFHPSEILNLRHCNSTLVRMSTRPQTRVHPRYMHLPPSSSTIPRYVQKFQPGKGGLLTRAILSSARRRSIWPSRVWKHLFSYREPDSSTCVPSLRSFLGVLKCGKSSGRF